MLQVNFLPWRQQHYQRWCRHWWWFIALCVGSATVIVIAIAVWRYGTLIELNTLNTQLQNLQKSLSHRLTQSQQSFQQQQRLHAQQQIDMSQKQNNRKISLLWQCIYDLPHDLWLTSFKLSTELVIEGMSMTYSSVTSLLAILHQCRALTDTKIVQLIRANLREPFHFSVSAQFIP